MDRDTVDPVCAICSKPVRSGGVRFPEGGPIYHLGCRNRELQLKALEQIDRAQVARTLRAELVDQMMLGKQRWAHPPISRLPLPPRAVPLLPGAETLYEVELSAVPSLAWRTAFLRPPSRLVGARSTPEMGRVGLAGSAVHFRTTPDHLEAWLYRIDGWIEYANSVAAERSPGAGDA